MNKILLVASLILSGIVSLSQPKNRFEGIRVNVHQHTILKSKPAALGYDARPVRPNSKMLIIDVSPVAWLYKVVYQDSIYYADKHAIRETEGLSSFLQRKQEEFDKNLLWIQADTCAMMSHHASGSERRGMLIKGTRVLWLEQKGDWVKIENLENVEQAPAWVRIGDVSHSEVTPLPLEAFRKYEYLGKHRDTEKKFADAIRTSAVIPGMDKEMVKASLGPPDSSTQTLEDNIVIEHWRYHHGFTVITFVEGRVDSCRRADNGNHADTDGR